MPLKPFFRRHDNWWVVQLRQGRKRWQHKLVKGTPPRGADSEKEAYRLFNELMAQDRVDLPPPSRIRIHDILEGFLRYSAEQHGARTFEWYKLYLVNFDDRYGNLRPQQLTPEVVDAWLKANPTWKGGRRCAVVAIKRAFNWAFDNKKIVINPAKQIAKPAGRSRERFLTPEERRRIFESFPESDPFRDFLFALEQTACRPGEIASVTAAHVDLHAGVWVLDQHKTAKKTGEPRYVILTPAMLELTKRLMAERPDGPLFRNSSGMPRDRNSIRCRFRRVREKLGLGDHVVAYLYRHAVCTDLLEAGVGIVQTCEILGHKDTTMVMKHYSKIRGRRDHLREEITRAFAKRA